MRFFVTPFTEFGKSTVRISVPFNIGPQFWFLHSPSIARRGLQGVTVALLPEAHGFASKHLPYNYDFRETL